MIIPVRKIFNRYFLSLTLPVVVAWAIYADYSHTQEWKRKKIEKYGH